MSIKYISFDLDDTFWDVMPTIYRAEDKTKEWIKDNFPGVSKVMDKDTILIFDQFVINDSWEQDEFKALNEFCSINHYSYEVIAISFFTKQVAVKLIGI